MRRQAVLGMLIAHTMLLGPGVAHAGEIVKGPRVQISVIVSRVGGNERISEVDATLSGEGRTWFARTDASGEFLLEVPPGRYDLTLTRPGLAKRRLTDISVDAGDSRALDITMESMVVETSDSTGQQEEFMVPLPPVEGIEDIVVSAKYVAGSVEQTQFSESVLDVLGSADFRLTGDSSVISAMARVTGVTIVDDKFVYVRGLGERYSSTLFNSAMLPSPDPARRVVPLDLFPSGVMEQLAVQKTWAPYLPADFSGGSLQMKARSVSDEPEAKATISVEYNTETTGRRVPWYKGDSADWTGFEGGRRGFPGELESLSQDGRLPPPGLLSDEDLRAAGLSLDNSYETSNPIAPPNITVEYADGNSVDTRAGRFGWLAGVRYTNDWKFNSDGTANIAAQRDEPDDRAGSFYRRRNRQHGRLLWPRDHRVELAR